MTAKQAEPIVEKLIDDIGLSDLLGVIVGICGAKADHVASNWQDQRLARAWERAGSQIDAVDTEDLP